MLPESSDKWTTECDDCITLNLLNWGHGMPQKIERAQKAITVIRHALTDGKKMDAALENELDVLESSLNTFKDLTSPLKKEQFNLNDLASERLLRYHTYYHSTGIQFSLKTDPSQLNIIANWRWLSRLLDSLVNNSADELMNQTKRNIDMVTLKEGQFAHWVIEDNGRGMTRAQFEQKINLRPEALDERGRGLFVANRLINLFRGTLDLYENAAGTKLIISLPLQK